MATVLSPRASTSSQQQRPSLSRAGPSMTSKEDAARISGKIDEEIRRESAKQKEAKKREVKVMLLGQADSGWSATGLEVGAEAGLHSLLAFVPTSPTVNHSNVQMAHLTASTGKSTLQKQFQLFYAQRSLDSERLAWVPIVYSNIIKAVRIIFAELEYETSLLPSSPASSTRSPAAEPLTSRDVQADLARMRHRLLPLLSLETALATELSGGVTIARAQSEAFVRTGWQTLVRGGNGGENTALREAEASRARATTALVARTLGEAVDDIEALWTHDAVRFYARQRRIRLDDSASYFLRCIQRIAEPEYIPTNDDILHVRLRTLGVMQHSFPMNMAGRTYKWTLYDVGGARGQRPTWIPYFDDATAIIFLAPLSAFDQYLEEDPRTNRIDDSLQLFGSVCSNTLLHKAHLVLLLNKMDILREKLDAGAYVRRYITSFGTRANNFETVADYFRSHFVQVHRKKDEAGRKLFIHFTSMLDIQATQSIIGLVGEAILRKHVADVGLA